MKYIFYLIFYILITMVSFSCAGDEYETRLVYQVNKIEIAKTQIPQTTLQVEAVVPNPCYQFSHLEMNRQDHDIEIKIYAKVKKDVNCIQVLGKIEVPVSLDQLEAGDYQVHFSGRSAYLDTLIHIPKRLK